MKSLNTIKTDENQEKALFRELFKLQMKLESYKHKRDTEHYELGNAISAIDELMEAFLRTYQTEE
jgi:hypothetical protein